MVEISNIDAFALHTRLYTQGRKEIIPPAEKKRRLSSRSALLCDPASQIVLYWVHHTHQSLEDGCVLPSYAETSSSVIVLSFMSYFWGLLRKMVSLTWPRLKQAWVPERDRHCEGTKTGMVPIFEWAGSIFGGYFGGLDFSRVIFPHFVRRGSRLIFFVTG